jgi:signal transduction histidine kinase/PAS domain-containing protein
MSMVANSRMATDFMVKPSQCAREVLVEQILWLIRLRWIAVVGMLAAALLGSHVFPVLSSPIPIYLCAAALLISNISYFLAATKKPEQAGPRDLVLGMIQVELDLLILTAVLHFSGGVANPFFLFYIFHVIIAAIILPRNLSFCVGLTTILLFGLLEVNELSGGTWLGYHPLQLLASGGPWRNPVYELGVFGAFACTVILAQYLTRMIITRMRAKELEAARNNDVLRAIINAMSEGLIFVTREGNVAICNPAARLWKEQNGAIEPGHSLEDFPRSLAELLKTLVSSDDGAGAGEKAVTFETVGPRPKYVEARSCPVIGVDGKRLGHVVVGQDLTEHKKLETDLRERTEDLTSINEILKVSRLEMAQREKMVAIGQMATGIAHEIGNPLASISSVAQYLVRKLTVHEQKEHLLVIQYHISRISNILKRMLSLSRPATSEYRWTNINDLIENTLSLINFDKRAQSVTIKDIANPDLPTVWLNPQHFEQVFLNIFINALDAMDAKRGEWEHVLEITRELKDGMIEIRTSDTGIGMSPEVRRRAFESFYTTKEVGKGTGLGLFISYNLVTEVDGTIFLESEPGKGTTVIIRIPARSRKDLVDGNDTESRFLNRAKAV